MKILKELGVENIELIVVVVKGKQELLFFSITIILIINIFSYKKGA